MDILNNIYKSPRKPTVVLLVETRFSNIRQVVNNYLKSIVCDKIPFCNQCEMCKKIDNKSYYDLLILDGNKSPDRLDPFGSKERKIEDYISLLFYFPINWFHSFTY